MEDNVVDVEEITEKGITVTTVIADGLTETVIHQTMGIPGADGQFDQAGIAVIQNPRVAGPPVLQHDIAVRDVHAGKYGDFSEQPSPEVAP